MSKDEQGSDPEIAAERGRLRERMKTEMGDTQIPDGYEVRISGVRDPDDNVIARAPIWAYALSRAQNDREWMMLVRGWDWMRRRIETEVLFQDLHGRPSTLAAKLAEYGFVLEVNAGKALVAYLSAFRALPHLIRASSTGWHEHPSGSTVFVLPSRVIGQYAGDAYDLRRLEGSELARGMVPSGTIEEWKRNVADPCRGNPVLMFGIMQSLCNPLIRPLDAEVGGVHLRGPSSTGKTTSLLVASCVWGSATLGGTKPGFALTWNSTANALEGTAASRCDVALVLDEVGEFEGGNFGRLVYALSAGVGRTRMRSDTSIRDAHRWRFNYLSTGEKSVEEMLQRDGPQRVRAGQMIRLMNVETEGRVIVDTHGNPNVAAWVEGLCEACRSYYGVAGPLFVEYLLGVADGQDSGPVDGARLRERFDAVSRALVPPNVDGQQRRAIRRLALAALAGCLACEYGILPYTEEEVLDAVAEVRNMWLGDCVLSDAERAARDLKEFIEDNKERRIQEYAQDAPPIRDSVAFKYRLDGRDLFLFSRSGLRRACGVENTKEVCAFLADRGLLHMNSKPRYQAKITPIHNILSGDEDGSQAFAEGSKVNFYAIEARILNFDFGGIPTLAATAQAATAQSAQVPEADAQAW